MLAQQTYLVNIPGGKIESVSIDVNTAFTGYSGGEPNIEVGTIADPMFTVIVPSNDLTETSGRFLCNADYTFIRSNAQDEQIRARCNYITQLVEMLQLWLLTFKIFDK